MSGGLPAFGLGGVFYLLLITWMVLLACGRNRLSARWAFIRKMSLMGIAMIAMIACEWIILRKSIEVAGKHIPSLAGATPTIFHSVIVLPIPPSPAFSNRRVDAHLTARQ